MGRRRCTVSPPDRFLVIVRDFDVVGIAFLPSEADPKLIIDPDAVLARAVAPQALQAISRRYAEFSESLNPIDLCEFASCCWPELYWTSLAGSIGRFTIEDVFSSTDRKGSYHGMYYNDYRYKQQGLFVTLTSCASAAEAEYRVPGKVSNSSPMPAACLCWAATAGTHIDRERHLR